MEDLFAPRRYVVEKIDGDYAWLKSLSDGESMPVARALLPAEIEEGTRLLWRDLQYSMEL